MSSESFEVRCGVIPGELPSTEVFPGGTTEGALCWSVRTEDVEALVRYTDSDVTFDEEDRVYVALRQSPSEWDRVIWWPTGQRAGHGRRWQDNSRACSGRLPRDGRQADVTWWAASRR